MWMAKAFARQRLSKQVKTHATIEVGVFAARYWATSSATQNKAVTVKE
jgi:hypothetical protein